MFRVLIAGGTGQVGSAVVRALLACAECKEVVAVVRKTATLDERVRQVVLDSAAETFESEVTRVARSAIELGDPLYAASCIGIGKGSARWSEADMTKLEVGVVGAFARGCFAAGVERFGLLSAAGSTPKSRIRYVRVMGQKEEVVKAIGFPRLSIFRPGIIAGNVNTPGYASALGRLIPGSYGTIEQDDIGRAFVAELARGAPGITLLENGAMKKLARA
ncbi:MAG TPA: NAD(P)H-binding protein [Polyangiaceae bacterium]|nr:NAD(P)H-binding protein [Polyangiaceae bacterium]